MADFKDRLLEEQKQLSERISKLTTFMSSDAFFKIDPVQQSLLIIQSQVMVAYHTILTERIKALLSEPVV